MPHTRPRVLGERVPRRKTVEHREEQRRERVDARHRERHPEGMRGEGTRISSRWIEQALPISRALIKLAEDHLMPVDPGCSPPRCLNPRSPRASALIHHAPARGSGNGHAAGASGRAHHDLAHADPSKRRTRYSPFLDGSTRRSLQDRAHPTGPIIYGLRQTHSCSKS